MTSEELRVRASRYSQRVHLFPSGVSLEAFERDHLAVPDDLQALPRPVAGYVGGLHQWVDQELLEAAATQLPDVSFALIGPAQVDISKLAALPNVHLFGQRPHAEVPRYINGFDGGLVPYRISSYTANVYPAKMNEYLVLGKPVVATDLAEVRRFNREHGDLIRTGTDAAGFAAAIRAALVPATAEEISRRRDAARANGWDQRIRAMFALIDPAVDARDAGARGWEAGLRALYSVARRRTAQAVLAVMLCMCFSSRRR